MLFREIDSARQRGLEHPLKEYNEATAPLARWWVRKSGAGESYADLCLRLRVFLEQLTVSAAGLRVIIVCHAHVIRAFRALLEDVKSYKYDELLVCCIDCLHADMAVKVLG